MKNIYNTSQILQLLKYNFTKVNKIKRRILHRKYLKQLLLDLCRISYLKIKQYLMFIVVFISEKFTADRFKLLITSLIFLILI